MVGRGINNTLRLPVQMVNGQWELIYGGVLPVREGAYAEMLIGRTSIRDESLLKLLTQQFSVRVLPEGTELRIAVRDHAAVSSYTPDKYDIKVAAQYWPGDHCRFVPVWLGPVGGRNRDMESGGLWMRHTGLDQCELESSLVELPTDLNEPHAQSLNHALTMLSERYETHRLSHTGNVYERVFYQESKALCYPLSTMRDGVLERAEREFLAGAWRQIEDPLGWCRLPSHRKGEGSP